MEHATSGLPEAAVAALRAGNKIEAIKIVRLQRGLNLKGAKDAVEAHLAAQPALAMQFASASAGGGRRGLLLLLGIAALCVLVYVLFVKR
jgi:hypothetical protein